ncbi:hypothetical protein ACJJTC_006787 [Scirpophaga incertulas]
MADTKNYAYEPVCTGNGALIHGTHRMEQGQLWRQYLIAAVASIAVASTGYSMGWTSPVNSKLNNTSESPLPEPITPNEAAWIGSLVTVGAIFGPFLGGYAASKIGRRWGLLSSTLPLFAGWAMVLLAKSVGLLYAARVAWGLGVGMIFTISPMYCAEIATDEARGALGSFLQLFITFGFLLVYGIGPFISYSAIAYIGIIFVAAFAAAFYFMPETPTYLLTINDREGAAKSLACIRGKSIQGVEAELSIIADGVAAAQAKTASIADVFRGANFKAFYISCALVFFQQFSGINAVLFYMTDIFKAAGSSMDPAISTIIIGIVQMIASGITPMVADRLGRRMLLLVSSCGTAIGLALLGTYFLLAAQQSPLAGSLGFLPVASLVLFIVTYCWGLGPLPWAVMSELLPVEVKAAASPLATAFCWVLGFLITRYFSTISIALGTHFAFWLFGVFCIGSFFFTLLVVPETKGKSFSEIQDILAGRPTKPEKV